MDWFSAPEGRWLRLAVTLGSVVPIGAGCAGVLFGPRLAGLYVAIPADFDSHFRYLSGLLLGVGLGFLSTVPRIEAQSVRFQSLAAIVVLGGLGRLTSVAVIGVPSAPMTAALVMELAVTPALAVWQYRAGHATKASSPGSQPAGTT